MASTMTRCLLTRPTAKAEVLRSHLIKPQFTPILRPFA